jgi:hypothetical protein
MNKLRKFGLEQGLISPRDEEEKKLYVEAMSSNYYEAPDSAKPLPDAIWQEAGRLAVEDPERLAANLERLDDICRNGYPQSTVDLMRQIDASSETPVFEEILAKDAKVKEGDGITMW